MFLWINTVIKIYNDSIKKNIFEVLDKNNIEYDIYLHTYNLKKITNKRSNEINCDLDYTEYKLLYPFKYKIDDQNIFDKNININNYLKHGDPWPENPKNIIIKFIKTTQ